MRENSIAGILREYGTIEKFKLSPRNVNKPIIYKNDNLNNILLKEAIKKAETMPRDTTIKGAQVKYLVYRFDRNTQRSDFRIKKMYRLPDGRHLVRSSNGKLMNAQAYIARANLTGAIV